MENNDVDDIINILNDAEIKNALPKPEFILPKYLHFFFISKHRIPNLPKPEQNMPPATHQKVISGIPAELMSLKAAPKTNSLPPPIHKLNSNPYKIINSTECIFIMRLINKS